MVYTLKNLPDELDRALRERAAAERKSIDATLVDALARGLGVAISPTSEQAEELVQNQVENRENPSVTRDLSDIVGTWEEDPEFDAALEDQRRIDPEMWQ